MTYGVILFHTTTSAIRAEKILLKVGLLIKLVPTPRDLSSDCGISLRFSPVDEDLVRFNLDQAQLEYEICYLEKY